MNDLNRLVEEYFKPSKKEPGLNIQSLLEMVEEVLDALPPLREAASEEKKVIDTEEKKETQIVEIALPFVQLSEAWGKPSEQREEVSQFIENMGVTASAESPTATLRARVGQLKKFLDVLVSGSAGDIPISEMISNILLLDTLAAIVTGGEESQYSASPAGFLFESFLAALAGGTSRQIPAAGAGTIADITIDLGTDDSGVPVSLKLLSRKGGAVKGSIRDLVKSFKDQTGVDLQKAWGAGPPEEVEAWRDSISGRENPEKAAKDEQSALDFVRSLGIGDLAEAAPRETEAVYDPETGKIVSRADPATEIGGLVGDDISGMKYIIVLKTPKKGEGTLLQFYEFDFTYEKFVAWVEADKIPEPDSGETQFKLTLTDYIYGPGGKGSGGGAVEIASFVLPSSKQVRLKAQDILKTTYQDFYKILHTLKNTTDHLNEYLADPTQRKAGKTAAKDADTLEKDITKTTADN